MKCSFCSLIMLVKNVSIMLDHDGNDCVSDALILYCLGLLSCLNNIANCLGELGSKFFNENEHG